MLFAYCAHIDLRLRRDIAAFIDDADYFAICLRDAMLILPDAIRRRFRRFAITFSMPMPSCRRHFFSRFC
jgi:hypothetical protein